ncbi:MAG TPA: hypothetical protein VJB02_04880 [Coxiellaceae bacterium]|nr:hypothetical protein [Coxiellaceae bacterium]
MPEEQSEDLHATIQHFRARISQLNKRILALEERCRDLEYEVTVLKTRACPFLERLARENGRLGREIQELTEALAESKTETQRLEEALTQARKEIQQWQDTYGVIEEARRRSSFEESGESRRSPCSFSCTTDRSGSSSGASTARGSTASSGSIAEERRENGMRGVEGGSLRRTPANAGVGLPAPLPPPPPVPAGASLESGVSAERGVTRRPS